MVLDDRLLRSSGILTPHPGPNPPTHPFAKGLRPRRGGERRFFRLLSLVVFIIGLSTENALADLSRRWTIYVAPYSHLDVGFTQTQANVLAKQKHNIRTAMDLIEQTADWPEESRFKYLVETSWPAIEFIRDPEIPQAEKTRFATHVQSGNIEIGAFYINHTNRFLDGESLLASVELTRRELADPFGVSLETAVIDDVCDGSGIGPALVHTGVRYFQLACNVSHWALPPLFRLNVPGHHGPGVLVYLPPFIGGYNGAFDLSLNAPLPFDASSAPEAYEVKIIEFLTTLESDGIAPLARVAFDYPQTVDYPYDAILVPYPSPHGPDNGEQDLTISEIARDWNARYENPRIVVATPRDFFRHVEEGFTDSIPVLKGELGGFWGEQIFWDIVQSDPAKESAARTFMRQANASGLLLALADNHGESRGRLRTGYEKLLLNTDHNPAPVPFGNTSYTEEDVQAWKTTRRKWVEEMSEIGDAIFEGGLASLIENLEETDGQPAILVYNPLPWERSEIVPVILPDKYSKWAVVDHESGETMPSAPTSDVENEIRFLAQGVPAIGYKTFKLEPHDFDSAPVGEIRMAPLSIITADFTLDLSSAPFGIRRISRPGTGETLVEAPADLPLFALGTVQRPETGPFGGGNLSGLGARVGPTPASARHTITAVKCDAIECSVSVEHETPSGLHVIQSIALEPRSGNIEHHLLFESPSTQSVEHVVSVRTVANGKARLTVDGPHTVLEYGHADPLGWLPGSRPGDLFATLELIKPMRTINATNEIFQWIRGIPPSLVFRNFAHVESGSTRVLFSSLDSGTILPSTNDAGDLIGFDHICLGSTSWGNLGLGAKIGDDVLCRSALFLPVQNESASTSSRSAWAYTHPMAARFFRTHEYTSASYLRIEASNTVGWFWPGSNAESALIRLFQSGPEEEVRVHATPGFEVVEIHRSDAHGQPICRMPSGRRDAGYRFSMAQGELRTLMPSSKSTPDLPICEAESGGNCACSSIGASRVRPESLLIGCFPLLLFLIRKFYWRQAKPLSALPNEESYPSSMTVRSPFLVADAQPLSPTTFMSTS